MNNFASLQKRLEKQVSSMLKDTTALFIVDLDKDKLWETYLKNFPAGTLSE